MQPTSCPGRLCVGITIENIGCSCPMSPSRGYYGTRSTMREHWDLRLSDHVFILSSRSLMSIHPCTVVERVGFRSNCSPIPNAHPKSTEIILGCGVANVTLHANHSIRSPRSHGVT